MRVLPDFGKIERVGEQNGGLINRSAQRDIDALGNIRLANV